MKTINRQIISEIDCSSHRSIYAICIGACGYEHRAIFAIDELLKRGVRVQRLIGILFDSNKALDFERNREFFEAHAACFIRHSDLRRELVETLRNVEPCDLHVLFDISSCTREVIANVLLILNDFASSRMGSVTIDFVYSLAEYAPPPVIFGPIKFNGPVLPEFSGLYF